MGPRITSLQTVPESRRLCHCIVGLLLFIVQTFLMDHILHRKAAEGGDAHGKAFLGHYYMQGIGVEQNNETALMYFRDAAASGSIHGIFGLGYMYLYGHGITKDYRTAHQYLKQAGDAVRPFHPSTRHVQELPIDF